MIKRWKGCLIKDSKIREPVQKRAIEKRDRILKCGFKLMCEKGYHNVDCIEIAESAKVSTGTVYQYFKDKKDIFLQGLQLRTKETLFPVLAYQGKKVTTKNYRQVVRQLIDATVKKHYLSKKPHEEIMAMKHSDKDVAKIFNEFEVEATNALVDIMQTNQIMLPNLTERAHLIIIWVDELCHEIIYHKHKELDLDVMKEMVIDAILQLIEKK